MLDLILLSAGVITQLRKSHATIGVVGMMAAKPVVLPEPFSGEASWDDWKLHFEDVAEVNAWTAEDKLKWLRVRLTSRAQRAFHRLPANSQASYAAATLAMQQRFEPKSRMTRYQAEFEARRKNTLKAGPTSQKICAPSWRRHTRTYKPKQGNASHYRSTYGN